MAEPLNLTTDTRRWAFSALLIATVLAVLDISAINLALPVIAQDLQQPLSAVLWLSKASLLACAISILPCSALADLIGHRRSLLLALAAVIATSIGCAISQNLMILIALRVVHGIASAMIMCTTLVLLREIFPVNQLGKALGLNALCVALASTGGPALSGALLSFLSWHWLFLIGPVLGILAWLVGYRYLPEKRQADSSFDLLGSGLLLAISLTLLSYYTELFSWQILLLLPLLLLLFIQKQQRVSAPLLPLMLFTNVRFNYSLLASVIAFIGQNAALIALPIALQQVMGYGPLQTALAFISWPLATAISGPWAGRFADRFDARLIAGLGLVIFALGLATLATLSPAASTLDVLWRTAICGLGFGLFQSPNNREILTNAAPQYSARAAALLSAARLLGQSLGVILISVMLSSGSEPASLEELFLIICLLQLAVVLLWFLSKKWPSLNTNS